MHTKIKVYLTDKVYAIMTIKLEIPKDQRNLAESLGIGDYEQNNLIGQQLQTMLALLGNSDEV